MITINSFLQLVSRWELIYLVILWQLVSSIYLSSSHSVDLEYI